MVVLNSVVDNAIKMKCTEGYKQLEEPILDDSYPVYLGYLYVVEVKKGETTYLTVVSSDLQGTVRDLWLDLQKQGVKDIIAIKRCDIAGRNLWHLTV